MTTLKQESENSNYCSGCNKKVKAFVIEPTLLFKINGRKTTLAMLGCPECNNIFYKRD